MGTAARVIEAKTRDERIFARKIVQNDFANKGWHTEIYLSRGVVRAGLTYRLIRLTPKASRLRGPREAPYILYTRSRLTKFKLENSENVVFSRHLWHILFPKLILASVSLSLEMLASK